MTFLASFVRTRRATLITALALAAALLGAAFLAAWLTRDLPLFSLLPPGGGVADIQPGQRQDLHRTFFTIWASLLLAMPALALVWFKTESDLAARGWLLFWSAAWLVFMVHFYWAVSVIFGNDWDRIRHTARVSAPILDTVFAVWWTLDVCLAWLLSTNPLWVRVQRGGVHILAFVLFFMGAAREGELLASRSLGWALAAVTACGLVVWGLRLRRSGATR